MYPSQYRGEKSQGLLTMWLATALYFIIIKDRFQFAMTKNDVCARIVASPAIGFASLIHLVFQNLFMDRLF